MSSVPINSNHSIILVNTTSGAKSIQLPLISDNPGRVIYFKDTFNTTSVTNYIKLLTSNGDTFENGLTSNIITTAFQSYGLLANPFTNNWNIITKYDTNDNFIGISSLSSIVSYGLSSLRVEIGISSLSSIVSYGLSSLGAPINPGVSSLSSIVSYGLSSLGGQTAPGISSLSSIVSYGLSSLGAPINPGVSSLSSIVSYGLSSLGAPINPGVSSLSSIVSYGLSSLGGQTAPGISSLSSIVSYGLSSLGGQTAPGISSLSSIVSYGLSSLIAPINPGVSSLSSIISYGLSSLRVDPGISSLSSIVSYGLSSLIAPINPGVSSLSSIISYGLSSLRVDPGISSLSSIVSYGLSSLGAPINPGVSSLSSIVSYGLSSLGAPINPGVSSLSSIVSYGLSSLGGQTAPGISSLSSIVSYGLSSMNNLINNSVTTQSLQVFSNIFLGSPDSNSYIAFSGCNNNFNNRVLAEYGDNLLLFAGADSGGINQDNNLALVASKGIYFYINRTGAVLGDDLNLGEPTFASDTEGTRFSTRVNCTNGIFTFGAAIIGYMGVNSLLSLIDSPNPIATVDIIGSTSIVGNTIIDGNTILEKTKKLQLVFGGDDSIINYPNYKVRIGALYFPNTTFINGESIKDVKYYNNNYIAVGKSIYHSTDGATWTNISNTVNGGLGAGQGYCVFYDILNNNWIVTGNWDQVPLYYTTNPTGLDGWTYIINSLDSGNVYNVADTFTHITVNPAVPNMWLIGLDNPAVTMYYTPNYTDISNYTGITLDSGANGLVINYIYSLYNTEFSSVAYLATGSNTINNGKNVIYSPDGSNWSIPTNDIGGGGTTTFFANAGYGITTDLTGEGIFIVVGDDTSGNNIFISTDYTGSSFLSQSTNNYIPSLADIPLHDIQNLNKLQTNPNLQYRYYEPYTFIFTSRTSNISFIASNITNPGQEPIAFFELSSPNRVAYRIGLDNNPSLFVSPAEEVQYTSPTRTGYGGIHIGPSQYTANCNIIGITFGTDISGQPTEAGILATRHSNVGTGNILHIMNSKNIIFGMEEVITIDGNNNNNIGINQPSPQYTLDISGNINTGGIYYNSQKPRIVYMNVSNSTGCNTPVILDITADGSTYYPFATYVAVVSGWNIKGTTSPITSIMTIENVTNNNYAVQFDCESSSSFTTANFVFTISPLQMYDIVPSSGVINI